MLWTWRASRLSLERHVSTWAVALAVALLASACTTASSPTSRSSPVPTDQTVAFDFPLLDAPGKPFPKVAITVPHGWGTDEGSSVQGPHQLAVSFWNVVDMYANSCHWLGPMIHAGPTVNELGAVFADRPLRSATAPVAVSVGAYHGKYMEWSVPVDIQFSDCDQGTGDTYGWFESWTGNGTGERIDTSRVQARSTGCGSSTSRAVAW